ncbi:MAG TPA: glycosyltransferase [Bryobacteraceae bacterium]|nr:glycosyltransferase [Bryobacteraceae bacterium]
MSEAPIAINPARFQSSLGSAGNGSARAAAHFVSDERFCASLGELARDLAGPAVLAELDARALETVLEFSPDDTQIYFVHTDAAILRHSFVRLSRQAPTRDVVYFHGTVSEFLRDIPTNPILAVVPSANEAFLFWQDLAHGSILLCAEGLTEEEHWSREGFLQRIGGGERHAIYRSSGKFRASAQPIPNAIFRQLSIAVRDGYFGARGHLRSGRHTPLSQATEEVRRWQRSHSSPSVKRHTEWPYKDASTPLPETMPNGERWPLISVVTPSFNQGRYLEETILSVAGQGYPRIEHIVMDGGSTDETVAVLQRYRHCLASAVSEKYKGQSNAINKGMALTTGSILTWLHSDDLLAPGALAAVAMGFHTSQADLVAGVVTLRSNGRTVGHHMTSCEPGPLPLDDLLDLDGGWNTGKFFYQPEVMFSRDIWERAGGMVREDLYYSMDYDLWVRMAEAGGGIHVVGHPIAWFRMHEEQKTHAEARFKEELIQYVSDFHTQRGRAVRPTKAFAAPKRTLRVAMLNDHGFAFGAGIAHQRMAEAIARAGHTVVPLSLRPGPGDTGEFTTLTTLDIAAAVAEAKPDLIISGNLHSAVAEAQPLGRLVEQYPTLAVLHDFWLLTGRCAYPTPCTLYRSGCNETCPTADEYPPLAPEKISGAWARKQQLLFGENQLALLANSSWAKTFALEAMRASGGGRTGRRVAQFRLSFPLDVFRMKDRATCRAMLGLPEDRFIVLLSGDLYDARKNTQLALDALEQLALPDLTIVSLGHKREGETFPFEDIRRLGHLRDPQMLAHLYAAADLYVAPSREETFGQVFIESIACGTPVVGVRASGMQEAVVDGLTGLLVDEFSTEALGAAIYTLYSKPQLRQRMGQWGRVYAQNEWSPEAAYYHLFQAWRELGLLQKLQVPEKIGFVAEPGELAECQTIRREGALTQISTSLGPEEGPYPEFALPRFRWAYGPVSEVQIHSPDAGTHSLVVRYRNMQPGQTVQIALNGSNLGTYALAETGIARGRVLCIRAELQRGKNALRMEFARWADPTAEGRPLAAAITELRFLPDISVR